LEALLVVDIQNSNGWSDEEIAENEARQHVAFRLVKTIHEMRNQQVLVVFIHMGGNLADFLKRERISAQEPLFKKTYVNAFSEKTLLMYLRQHNVDHVFIVGCVTFACVLATAQGALQNQLAVTLLSDSVYPPFNETGSHTRALWVKDATLNSKVPFRSRAPSIV